MKQNEKIEKWIPIKGHEGLYEVSNLARIKSLSRTYYNGHKDVLMHERILKQSNHIAGYKVVGLNKNGKAQKFLVHRLVATAFIPNPHNKPNINHKDGNGKNNSLDNLEWVTQGENIKHAYDCLGRKSGWEGIKGNLHPNSKKVMQLDTSGNLIKVWDCLADAIRDFDKVGSRAIYNCAEGRRDTCYGYKWEYV